MSHCSLSLVWMNNLLKNLSSECKWKIIRRYFLLFWWKQIYLFIYILIYNFLIFDQISLPLKYICCRLNKFLNNFYFCLLFVSHLRMIFYYSSVHNVAQYLPLVRTLTLCNWFYSIKSFKKYFTRMTCL